MSKATETNPTQKLFDNARTMYQPWIDAATAWSGEVQKMQAQRMQTAYDEMARAIDTSHRLAKESLSAASAFSAKMQQQVSEHISRSVEMFDASLKV